jgi:hypothetical protein
MKKYIITIAKDPTGENYSHFLHTSKDLHIYENIEGAMTFTNLEKANETLLDVKQIFPYSKVIEFDEEEVLLGR